MNKIIPSAYILMGTIMVILLAVNAVPVSAAENQWPYADSQDQSLAWGRMNADANMANLKIFASPDVFTTRWKPFSLSPADLQNQLDRQISPGNQITPLPPREPAGTDLKTIDGTPVNDLFKKAMDNYRTNPPKPMGIPGMNGTIYSHQIINWI